jgi:hypothetical protein
MDSNFYALEQPPSFLCSKSTQLSGGFDRRSGSWCRSFRSNPQETELSFVESSSWALQNKEQKEQHKREEFKEHREKTNLVRP